MDAQYSAGRDAKLRQWIDLIRESGRNHKYDCIVGVSGGVDSSYILTMVKDAGLRPLAVHFDNGWNSELAATNINTLLTALDIDLVTYVVDWEEFRSLQLAFLRASVPDAEIPTDHGIVSLLYKMAVKHNIKYIISGNNYKSEGTVPLRWTYGILDGKYISAINKLYGDRGIKSYPLFGMAKMMKYVYVNKIVNVALLNYLDYDKENAKKAMNEKYGWRPYEGKHYESIYTRFFQGYILPTKFGIDKRRVHLSALINSGQMTREAALEELKTPPLSEEIVKNDIEYVTKKLGIPMQQFEDIMNSPVKSFMDYESYNNWIVRARKHKSTLQKLHLWPNAW
jgi:N-acetyl sugar amidotransferase